jgi:signal transduction histidine kinase
MLARLNAAFNRQRQFTADASHELRTPLTIVNLETERALSSRHSTDGYEQALKIIQSENEFMIRLVNDLLTLARMDAGQTVLQPEELDLSDVTLEVVERLAPLAVRNNVKITTGELPELVINGDRQFLSQMLSNLVENAIKHTRGQEKRVYVETGYRTSRNGTQACVQVSDNGPGIAPEHLPHIFDRFYQVDKARTHGTAEGNSTTTVTESPSGSGLGLSIVQWIVQAHGGQVSVKSELGKGSTFEVSLPMEINYPNEPL